MLCVLSSVTIITFLSNGELTNDIGFCIFLFILLVISIILLFLGKKTKAEKKAEIEKKQEAYAAKKEQEKEKFTSLTGKFIHIAGLSTAPNVDCSLTLSKEALRIVGAGFDFNLSLTKITGMSKRTDTDIQKFVNQSSSAGKALAGAMMFGAVGALVGGRTKTTTTSIKTYRFFLVVTYIKDDSVDYLIFENKKPKQIDDFTYAFSLIQENNPMTTVEL